MKTTSAKHGENMGTTCSAFVVFMVSNSMNNLLSYCEFIHVKIRASDKDLPVQPKKRKKRKLKKIKLEKEGTDEEWNEPKRKRGRPRVRPLGESKEEDLDQGYYNTGWFKNDLSAC